MILIPREEKYQIVRGFSKDLRIESIAILWNNSVVYQTMTLSRAHRRSSGSLLDNAILECKVKSHRINAEQSKPKQLNARGEWGICCGELQHV
jgi:hypothetical protein